jgi:hypothetical protein
VLVRDDVPSAWAAPPALEDVTVMSTTPGLTFLYSWVSVLVVDTVAADWAGTEATTVLWPPPEPDEDA